MFPHSILIPHYARSEKKWLNSRKCQLLITRPSGVGKSCGQFARIPADVMLSPQVWEAGWVEFNDLSAAHYLYKDIMSIGWTLLSLHYQWNLFDGFRYICIWSKNAEFCQLSDYDIILHTRASPACQPPPPSHHLQVIPLCFTLMKALGMVDFATCPFSVI